MLEIIYSSVVGPPLSDGFCEYNLAQMLITVRY